MKFICLLNSYDSGNSYINTSVTLGKDSTSRTYKAAEANTNYAVYVVISSNGNFTGSNVAYEQKQEYAIKYKSADYTFSNFVCNTAETSTKAGTVASVAQGTNTTYTKDYIVEDERDNKYYIVRKLYMRNDAGTISTACWMTQNLDLDLVAQYESGDSIAAIYAYNRENNTKTKLTTTNTDLSDSWTNSTNVNSNMLYASTGGTNNRSQSWTTSYKFATLANGASPSFPTATSSGNSVTPSGNANSGNTPGMIDSGDIMFGPFDKTMSQSLTPASSPTYTADICETLDDRCYQFRNVKYFASEASGHVISDNAVGNYYNWYTATAGTGNSNITTSGVDVAGSICPKGWGLPTGYDTNNEFGQVMSAYFPTSGVTHQNGTVYTIGNNYTGFTTLTTLKSNSDNVLTDSPLAFTRSDGTNSTSGSSNQGVSVYYWSATSHSTNAYRLDSNSGRLYPGTYAGYRGVAYTVRCMSPAP